MNKALETMMGIFISLVMFGLVFMVFNKIVLGGGSVSLIDTGMFKKIGAQVGGVMEDTVDRMFDSMMEWV